MEHVAQALPGKHFFFCSNEYENYSDYQQQLTNTLIKHSGETYTFKIGVKELGFRTRATLNPEEQLTSPADYVRISIADKLEGDRFRSFAARVCNSRLARLRVPASQISLKIETVLQSLTEDEEAVLLGVDTALQDALAVHSRAVEGTVLERFRACRPLDQLLVIRWAETQRTDVPEAIEAFVDRPAEWGNRRTTIATPSSSRYSAGAGEEGYRSTTPDGTYTRRWRRETFGICSNWWSRRSCSTYRTVASSGTK